jgi:glycosyltransferase involved in cell wall biosynthesis
VFFSSLSAEVERPIVAVIASYNNEKWIKKNLESILFQDYSNFRIIYLDDCSSDATPELIKQYLSDPRLTYIRNETRKGSLANYYYGIHLCDNDEIVALIDGDDWLYNAHVFERVNRAYASANVWLTHGTLVEYPSPVVAWSAPIPKEIIVSNSFRTFRCPSHLRTFYAWLFKKINLEDLMYHDQFFSMTGDQALMFPMIEMAGSRHAFISDVLYVYNMGNTINDHRVDPELQRSLEEHIRTREAYMPLSSKEW